VQSLIEMGEITEEDAENHPRKNEVTNVLGLQRMHPPTVCMEPIMAQQGDMFLLCTDGLSGLVNDKLIEGILKKDGSLHHLANELIKMANEAGGNDNITLQLVRFENTAEELTGSDNTKYVDRIKKVVTNYRIPMSVMLLTLVAGILFLKYFYLIRNDFDIKLHDDIKYLKISTDRIKLDPLANDTSNTGKVATRLSRIRVELADTANMSGSTKFKGNSRLIYTPYRFGRASDTFSYKVYFKGEYINTGKIIIHVE
jgi:hypothetical protein